MDNKDLTNSDDSQLLSGIANADRKAFQAFLSRHLRGVVRFAQRYIHQHHDAEDIAQEVFLRVWQKAGTWRYQGYSVKSWLYRIAYNLCIDELRRKQPDNLTMQMEEQQSSASSEELVERDMELTRLGMAIDSLPERQRSALILCAYEGLSNQDAAEVMGCSVEALESLLARARRKLREQTRTDLDKVAAYE